MTFRSSNPGAGVFLRWSPAKQTDMRLPPNAFWRFKNAPLGWAPATVADAQPNTGKTAEMEQEPTQSRRATAFKAAHERISSLLRDENRLTDSAGPLVDLLARLHGDLAVLDEAIGDRMWHENSQGRIANPLLTHRAKAVHQIAALYRELKLTAPDRPPQKPRTRGAQPRDRSRNSLPLTTSKKRTQ